MSWRRAFTLVGFIGLGSLFGPVAVLAQEDGVVVPEISPSGLGAATPSPVASGIGEGAAGGTAGNTEGAGTDDTADFASVEFFGWLDQPSGPDWELGAKLFFVGMFGALIAAFAFLGDAIPSSKGQVRIKAWEADEQFLLAKRNESIARSEELVTAAKVDSERLAHEQTLGQRFASLLENKVALISRERWKLFTVGGTFYVLLGALTSTAVASTAIGAFAVGLAWTAVVDRLLARSGIQERDEQRLPSAKAVDEAADVLEDLEEENHDLQRTILELEAAIAEIAGTSAENEGDRDALSEPSLMEGEQPDWSRLSARFVELLIDSMPSKVGSNGGTAQPVEERVEEEQ